jgi:hypothetical protein
VEREKKERRGKNMKMEREGKWGKGEVKKEWWIRLSGSRASICTVCLTTTLLSGN